MRFSGALAVLVLVFFGLSILPLGGSFIGGTDVEKYFYWNANFVKEQLLSGSLPLWNPYYYSGHPFLANPQTFVFYPATLLFVLLPLPWAFNIDTILHFYLAALGMGWFIRGITGSTTAGLGAGVVYCFSGYLMEILGAGHLTVLHTAALLPWVFHFLESGYRTKQARYLLACGAVFGLQILGGEPQSSFYTILFLALYLCSRHAFAPFGSRSRVSLRFALAVLSIPLVAAGIGAAQILPSAEFAMISDRAANSFEFATQFSFPPRNFYTLLIPRLESPVEMYWTLGAYVGVLALILAATGAMLSKHRRQVWCLLVVLLGAMVVMFGHYTPVYRLLFDFVPGFSLFRIPARCLIVFVFALASLTGLGLDRLCRDTPGWRAQWALFAAWGLLFAALFAGGLALKADLASREFLAAAALFLAAAGMLALHRLARGARFAAIGFLAVLFLDPWVNYSSRVPRLDRDDLVEMAPHERIVAEDEGLYRVAFPEFVYRGADSSSFGINGYTPIVLDRYFRFVHGMAGIQPPTMGRHTLSWELLERGHVFSSKILNIRYALVRGPGGTTLLRANRELPRATLIRDAVIEPSSSAQLSLMRRGDFDPRSAILLESPLLEKSPRPAVPTPPAADDEQSVTVRHYGPNRIDLQSESSSPTHLLLSELFYPGWQAWVDGREVPIGRADYLLRAIAVPPGEHEISFVFRPSSFRIGAAVSLTSLGILFVALARRSGRARRLRHGQTSSRGSPQAAVEGGRGVPAESKPAPPSRPSRLGSTR